MVACVALQLHHLNKGLARFEALLVVPVYQTLWTVFAIGGGLIFFQEYRVMTRRGCLLYVVGNCISLVGVTILVVQRKRQTAEVNSPPQEIDSDFSIDAGEGADPIWGRGTLDEALLGEFHSPTHPRAEAAFYSARKISWPL